MLEFKKGTLENLAGNVMAYGSFTCEHGHTHYCGFIHEPDTLEEAVQEHAVSLANEPLPDDPAPEVACFDGDVLYIGHYTSVPQLATAAIGAIMIYAAHYVEQLHHQKTEPATPTEHQYSGPLFPTDDDVYTTLLSRFVGPMLDARSNGNTNVLEELKRDLHAFAQGSPIENDIPHFLRALLAPELNFFVIDCYAKKYDAVKRGEYERAAEYKNHINNANVS